MTYNIEVIVFHKVEDHLDQSIIQYAIIYGGWVNRYLDLSIVCNNEEDCRNPVYPIKIVSNTNSITLVI